MKQPLIPGLFFICVLAFASCKKDKTCGETPEVTVFKASGDIASQLTGFRNLLGNLNTAPGAAGGRREVNWDGIPDSLLDGPLPPDFFNPVGDAAVASRQRGLAYSGGNFQASAANFAHINREAASEFNAFSGGKVFANVSKSQWPVEFRVPGQAVAAGVSAFGAVFSDVDTEGSATLEAFNGTERLGTFVVPARTSGSSFSFLGIYFKNKSITKIIVRHQGVLSGGGKDVSQGGASDLVVMDDIIYSEPQPQ